MKIKNILLFLLLPMALLATRCGQDTVGDTTAREQNRERLRSDRIADQNKLVEGTYHGHKIDTQPNGKKTFNSTADYYLVITATKLNGGNVTLSPSLVGTLIIAPHVDTTNEPYQQSYPFSNGQFDQVGSDAGSAVGKLSFQLESQTNPTNVTCAVDTVHKLSCDWNTNGEVHMEFMPTTESALAVLNSAKKTKTVYVGQNERYSQILVEFESGEGNRDGTQVPVPILKGRMLFTKGDNTRVPSYFKTGNYYPPTGVVSLTLDDNTQGTMDCTIMKAGAILSCKWLTNAYEEFILTRAVKK